MIARPCYRGYVRPAMTGQVTAWPAAAIAATGALLGGLFVLAARRGWLSRNEAVVQRRHRRPDSRFVEVDGVRFHYVDQGQGPAIVFLHGSYLDLGVWDAWANSLCKHYRVVRIDRSAYGLTGRDPAEGYSYERESDLVVAFAAAVGLDRFAIVGASSGGTSAARLAAANPDRITAVVLINFPFNRAAVRPTRQYILSIWVRDRLLVNYQPHWHMAWTTFSNLADRRGETGKLINRLTDEANRPGILADRLKMERNCSSYSHVSRMNDFAAIRAPALLIWGSENPLLSIESGQAALAVIGSADKRIAVIEGASHWIPVEKPEESLAVVRSFLSRVLEREA